MFWLPFDILAVAAGFDQSGLESFVNNCICASPLKAT
jgi:hypothetical protein